jgi:O-antigen/teichoic acid export membrane protein
LGGVARGGTVNLLGAAIAGLATLGVTVLVSRHFSKPMAGAFFTATSAFLIVEQIASCGASTGLVYFVARLRSLGHVNRIPVILRAATVPVFVASMAAMVLLLAFAPPIAHVLLSGHEGSSGVTPEAVATALRALALTMPFAALQDSYLGAARGYHDMYPTVVLNRISLNVGQMVGIVVAAAAGSAALLAPLWALPYVPTAIISWLWLRRIRRRKRLPPHATGPDIPPELSALLAIASPMPSNYGLSKNQRVGSRSELRRMANANARSFWKFTIPRAIADLASIMVQRIDIVLVAIIKGPSAAAVYTVATRFLVAGQFGSVAISMATQPRLTELFALRDRRGANVVYQATTAWLVLLTWPLYLLSVVYGPAVLSIFGKSYSAGDTVMVILGLAMLLATASGMVDVVLITSGRSSWSLFNGLIRVGLNVGLDVLLIPKYGIVGAAIGWAAAIVVGNLMPLTQLAAVLKIHPFGKGSLAATTLMATAFAAIPLAARAVFGHGALPSIGAVAVGCVVAVIGLWLLRKPLQLSAMRGLLKRGRSR